MSGGRPKEPRRKQRNSASAAFRMHGPFEMFLVCASGIRASVSISSHHSLETFYVCCFSNWFFFYLTYAPILIFFSLTSLIQCWQEFCSSRSLCANEIESNRMEFIASNYRNALISLIDYGGRCSQCIWHTVKQCIRLHCEAHAIRRAAPLIRKSVIILAIQHFYEEKMHCFFHFGFDCTYANKKCGCIC